MWCHVVLDCARTDILIKLMELQTKIPLTPSDNPIDYQSKLVLLGSCFVENIGAKLDYFRFQKLQNPFGILFHPLAIANLVERAIEEKAYRQEEVFEQDGRSVPVFNDKHLSYETSKAKKKFLI